MRRVFISINVPEQLKKVAGKYIKPFSENGLARVGESNNWHITMIFCGYLDDERLKELKELVQKIASETEKFELTPDKIIFKNERMVWITFKYSQEFVNLTKRFIDFCNGEFRPIPHMTLARFQQKHHFNLKPLLPVDGIDITNETKSFIVRQIEIMESHLNRHGSKYELICRNYLR